MNDKALDAFGTPLSNIDTPKPETDKALDAFGAPVLKTEPAHNKALDAFGMPLKPQQSQKIQEIKIADPEKNPAIRNYLKPSLNGVQQQMLNKYVAYKTMKEKPISNISNIHNVALESKRFNPVTKKDAREYELGATIKHYQKEYVEPVKNAINNFIQTYVVKNPLTGIPEMKETQNLIEQNVINPMRKYSPDFADIMSGLLHPLVTTNNMTRLSQHLLATGAYDVGNVVGLGKYTKGAIDLLVPKTLGGAVFILGTGGWGAELNVLKEASMMATASMAGTLIDNAIEGKPITDDAVSSFVTGGAFGLMAKPLGHILYGGLKGATKALDVSKGLAAATLKYVADKAGVSDNPNVKALFTKIKYATGSLGEQAGWFKDWASNSAFSEYTGKRASGEIVDNIGNYIKNSNAKEVIEKSLGGSLSDETIKTRFIKDVIEAIENPKSLKAISEEHPLYAKELEKISDIYKRGVESNPIIKKNLQEARQFMQDLMEKEKVEHWSTLSKKLERDINKIAKEQERVSKISNAFINSLQKIRDKIANKQLINKSDFNEAKSYIDMTTKYLNKIKKYGINDKEFNKNVNRILKDVKNAKTPDEILGATNKIIDLLNHANLYKLSPKLRDASKELISNYLKEFKNNIADFMILNDKVDADALRQTLDEIGNTSEFYKYILSDAKKILNKKSVLTDEDKDKLINAIDKKIDTLKERISNKDNWYNDKIAKSILRTLDRQRAFEESRNLHNFNEYISRASNPIGATKERLIKTFSKYYDITHGAQTLNENDLYNYFYRTFNNSYYIAQIPKILKDFSTQSIDKDYFIYKYLFNGKYGKDFTDKMMDALSKYNFKARMSSEEISNLSSKIAEEYGIPTSFVSEFITKKMYIKIDPLGYVANYGAVERAVDVLKRGSVFKYPEGKAGKAVLKLISISKRYALSFSPFHIRTLIFTGIYGQFNQANALASVFMHDRAQRLIDEGYKKIQQFMVDHPEIPMKTYFGRTLGYEYERVFHSLSDMSAFEKGTNALKSILTWTDKTIWENVYPLQKVEATLKVIELYEKDLNKANLIRRMENINYIFGGTPEVNIYLNSSAQNVLRTILFAPDWLYSLFRQDYNALTARDLQSVTYITRMFAYTLLFNSIFERLTNHQQGMTFDQFKEMVNNPLLFPQYIAQNTTVIAPYKGTLLKIDNLAYEKEIFNMFYEPLIAYYDNGLDGFVETFHKAWINKTSLLVRLFAGKGVQDLISLIIPYAIPNKPMSQNIPSALLSTIGTRTYQPTPDKIFWEIYKRPSGVTAKQYILSLYELSKKYPTDTSMMNAIKSSIAYGTDDYITDKLQKSLTKIVNRLSEKMPGLKDNLEEQREALKSPVLQSTGMIKDIKNDFINRLKRENQGSDLIRMTYNFLNKVNPNLAKMYLKEYTGLDEPTWGTTQVPPKELYGFLVAIAPETDPEEVFNYAYQRAINKASNELGKEINYK